LLDNQTLRAAGYFIGSGVVEAGCKTVVGQHLKQSGMRLEPSRCLSPAGSVLRAVERLV
jgi:hypothetical protein